MGDLDLDELSPGDRARIEMAIDAFDQAASNPSPSNWLLAGNASTDALNERSSMMPWNFQKFCVANIAWSGLQLWDEHHKASDSIPLLEFAMNEIARQGWGPNGNATPLGRMHQYLVATWAEVRLVLNPPQPKRRGLFGPR